MSKAIFITNGEQEFNQLIATYLLGQGHRVTIQFHSYEMAERFQQSLSEEQQATCFSVIDAEVSENSVQAAVEQAVAQMDGLDVLIHGNEHADEEAMFEQDPIGTGDYIAEQFRRIYLFNKLVAAHMVRRKQGSIVFPIVYDALYYAGYPSSPMLNHGKISMMKCLSRELAAFKLATNVMTFGYYDADFDKETKKKKREALEIYGLKPALVPLQEMIPALDFLVNPPAKNISGQDFHIGAGIETGL